MSDEDYKGVPFKDRKSREAFWRDFEMLLERHPRIFESFDETLEDETDSEGATFNPNDPKFYQGIVVILSVRNTEDWESLIVLDPRTQSSYMTTGMISAAGINSIR